MESISPLSEFLVDVERAAIDAVAPVKAAIDSGCSLSKFLYVPNNLSVDARHYTFHCALFRNCDFEGGLHFLRQKAMLPPRGKLRVTGSGCDMYKELIGQVLGLEVEFVTEIVTIFRGPHFLLTHAISPELLFYPHVLPTKEIFPTIFVHFGSAAVGIFIGAQGHSKLLGGLTFAGRALLGLGKAIIGTSNYASIMELAAGGDNSHLDSALVVDHELMLPFGKLADGNKRLEDFSREDRAAALVRVIALSIANNVCGFIRQTSAVGVIIGGNGATGEPMRKMIAQSIAFIMGETPVALKFLRTGHTGAFGAMIACPNDLSLM